MTRGVGSAGTIRGNRMARGSHAVVVPVKVLSQAKSRIHVEPPSARSALALAFALDMLEAVSLCPSVRGAIVVTDEPVVRGHCCHDSNQFWVADPGSDLNAAIVRGVGAGELLFPTAAVAVVMADLPALRPYELSSALEAARAHQLAYVADAAGSGTTLLAGRTPEDLLPSFGPASASRHEDLGAVGITTSIPTLRRDVDTHQDLEEALTMGVGRWTRAAAARITAAESDRSCVVWPARTPPS